MGYSEEFLNQCREQGVDRRVWLVAADRLFIAPDPMMNHEDLVQEVIEPTLGAPISLRTAPRGDIFNAVARAEHGGEWLDIVQARFDDMLAQGLQVPLLGPDERPLPALGMA